MDFFFFFLGKLNGIGLSKTVVSCVLSAPVPILVFHIKMNSNSFVITSSVAFKITDGFL